MSRDSTEIGQTVSGVEREHETILNTNTVNANGSAELSVGITEQPNKPPCIMLLEKAEERKKYFIEEVKKNKYWAQGLDNSWTQAIKEKDYSVMIFHEIQKVRDLVNGPPYNFLKDNEKNILRLCLEFLAVYEEIENQLNMPKETWINQNLSAQKLNMNMGYITPSELNRYYENSMDDLLQNAIKVEAEINSINLDTPISQVKKDAWAYDDEGFLYGLVKSFIPGYGQADGANKVQTYFKNEEYGKSALSLLDIAPGLGAAGKLTKKGLAKLVSAYAKRKTVQEIRNDMSRILDGSSIRKLLNKFGRKALADCLCRGG